MVSVAGTRPRSRYAPAPHTRRIALDVSIVRHAAIIEPAFWVSAQIE